MVIKFACDGCGKKLSVKAGFAGRRSRCPACGDEIEIPPSAAPESEMPPPIIPPAMRSGADEEPGREADRRPFWKNPIVVTVTTANLLILASSVSVLLVAFGRPIRHTTQAPGGRREVKTQVVVKPREPAKQGGPEKQALAGPQVLLPRPAPAPAKARPVRAEDRFPIFHVGDEAVVYVDAGDIQENPNLGKSGVLKSDSVVLVPDYPWELDGKYDLLRRSNEFHRSIGAGDPDGIDEMIKNEDLVRVGVGIKVRIIKSFSVSRSILNYRWFSAMEPDYRGLHTIRIAEGESRGKSVYVTPKNLRRAN